MGGNITDSHATGDVEGGGSVGGLVGKHDRSGNIINNSYAAGNVTGDIRVGGLVGHNRRGSIMNSYSTGNVTGNSRTGGLIGMNRGRDADRPAPVKNSHYNIDSVKINGENRVTFGGLFDEQYQDWQSNNLSLDIDDYDDSLVPVEDHYEISSAQGLRDLSGFGGKENYTFRLVEDINLSEDPGLYITSYFSAEFDGNNHTISNLQIDQPFATHVGLISYIAPGGTVRNTVLEDISVNGDRPVGGLVGTNLDGLVDNSHSAGEVMGRGSAYFPGSGIGGLVGHNSAGTVKNSSSTATVFGENVVGGLVGSTYRYEATVNDSYAAGEVIGDGWRAGGLVGKNYMGEIHRSYATGNVSGERHVGGLVGFNHDTGGIYGTYATGDVTGEENVGGLVGKNGEIGGWDSYIRRSYSLGEVTGKENVGGLIGRHAAPWASDSFWDVETSGQNESAGPVVGKNSTEMKDVATYTNLSTEGLEFPWDFVDNPYDDERDEEIWDIDEDINDGYPYLNWSDLRHVSINSTAGGEVVQPGEGTFEYPEGSRPKIEAVSERGYRFDGWIGGVSEVEDPESKRTKIEILNDNVITASFEEIKDFDLIVAIGEGEGEVQVFYDEVEKTVTDSETFSIFENTTVTLEAEPDEGFWFDRWEGDFPEDEKEEKSIAIDMDDDKELTVHFEIDTYDLDLDVEGDGSVDVEPEKDEYEYGEKVDLTAVPEEGWYFQNWTGDVPESEEDEKAITVVMDRNRSLTAHLEEKYFELEVSVEGEGEVLVDVPPTGAIDDYRVEDEWSEEFPENLSIALRTEPEEGWEFSHWEGDHPENKEDESSIGVGMNDDKSLTAYFEEEEPPVEYKNLTITSTQGGEVVEPGEGTFEYEAESVVDLEATADRGYHFVGWIGDTDVIEDPASEETTIEVLDDHSITAEFAVDAYTLEIDSTSGGEVVEPGEGTFEYEAESVVDLEAVADEGWKFVEWTGDVSSENEEITVTMDRNRSVTAHFEEKVEFYELEVDVEGEGSVKIDGEEVEMPYDQKYEEGTEVGLEAVPEDDWKFVGWINGQESQDEEITVVVEEQLELTAVFEELEPAKFEFFDLRVKPEEPEVGEEVEISIDVTNTGELEGQHTVEFYLDGEEIGNDTVTVAAGETETASIYHSVEEAQEYQVEVEGTSTTFTVEEDTIDGWLIAGLVLSVIALIVLLWIGVRGYEKTSDKPTLRKDKEEEDEED